MNKTDLYNYFRSNYDYLDPEDFSGIFRLVVDIVGKFFNKSRAGILLGLVELGYDRGNFIGGFHRVGTNEIYLNKSALRIMRQESKSELYKAYIFHLLLHEYIHATGVIDEYKTRKLTENLSIALFGRHHPVGKIAIFGLGSFFPYNFNQEQYSPSPTEILNPEYILLRHRDSELTYI
ncbi:hypothetical protein [Candidatus Hodarchaeum mangrovi]